MRHTKAESDGRRQFLKRGVTAGAGAAAAALLPETVAAVIEEDREPEQAQKRGYRLTRHVLDYYKTANI